MTDAVPRCKSPDALFIQHAHENHEGFFSFFRLLVPELTTEGLN